MKKLFIIFVLIMCLSPAYAEQVKFGKAYELKDSTDPEGDFSSYESLANEKYPLDEHQLDLGSMYDVGHGTPEDNAKALEWYMKAAVRGDQIIGSNVNAKAKHNIAVMYEAGDGVNISYAKALEWYSKAARQGLAESQIQLSIMYSMGKSGLKNKIKAYMWASVGKANGDERGEGILKKLEEEMTYENIVKAQELAAQCSQSNYQNCGEDESDLKRILASLIGYLFGSDSHAEIFRDIIIFLSACVGIFFIFRSLGWRYIVKVVLVLLAVVIFSFASYQVKGFLSRVLWILIDASIASFFTYSIWQFSKADNKKELIFFPIVKFIKFLTPHEESLKTKSKTTAEELDADEQNALAYFYGEGKGGYSQNYKKALELFKKSARQGHMIAQYNLGEMYGDGKGVVMNRILSYMWYCISLENGMSSARDELNKLNKKMTQEDIEEAQELAKRCIDSNYKDCPE